MKITKFFAVLFLTGICKTLNRKLTILQTSTQTEHYRSADNGLTKCEAFSIFLLVPETHSHTTILTLHSKKQNRSQNSKNLFTRTTT